LKVDSSTAIIPSFVPLQVARSRRLQHGSGFEGARVSEQDLRVRRPKVTGTPLPAGLGGVLVNLKTQSLRDAT
jgi:hypothetical protein